MAGNTRSSGRMEETRISELPMVIELPRRLEGHFGKGHMYLPGPQDIERIIRTVPKGKLITEDQICAILATTHKTSVAAPFLTSLMVRIVAQDAERALQEGKKKVAPWWRVVEYGGVLNDNFPGGYLNQSKKLMMEGHSFTACRRANERSMRIEDVSQKLIRT